MTAAATAATVTVALLDALKLVSPGRWGLGNRVQQEHPTQHVSCYEPRHPVTQTATATVPGPGPTMPPNTMAWGF